MLNVYTNKFYLQLNYAYTHYSLLIESQVTTTTTYVCACTIHLHTPKSCRINLDNTPIILST